MLTFVYVQICNAFSCVDGEKVRPLHKVFSSTSQRSSMGLSLDTVVTNPCVKMISHSPWAAFSELYPYEPCHCHHSTYLWHQGEKKWCKPIANRVIFILRSSDRSVYDIRSYSITASVTGQYFRSSHINHCSNYPMDGSYLFA